jgi:hypothetical protein
VPGRIVDFRANVASSGRVRTLTLVGTRGEKTVTGSSIRDVLGLRSTWFRLGLLSLSTPSATVVYGSSVRLAGTARGVPRVSLEAQPYGSAWKSVGRLKVRNGSVSPSAKPKVTTDYRLESGGFRSGSIRLSVAPLVQLAAGADGASVTGLARPVLPGAAVQVQRLNGDAWVTVATTAIDTNGSYSAQLELSPGSYRTRVIAGHGFAVGVSDTVTVVAP